jgi:hypothetical protein
MSILSANTLTTFEKWEKPTFQDVVNVFEKLSISDENFTLFFGINERTYRRWTSKKTVNRLEKSTMPYGFWCVLIALSENKYIFGHVKKRDLSQVPDKYICSIESFVSPSKDILTLFVGKNSITGLQRTELAKLFGWNAGHLGREFNKGSISFLNWVLLMMFCGVNINQLIDRVDRVWESDDNQLYLRRETTSEEIVWVESGRVNFVAELSLFSVNFADDIWFLSCNDCSQTLELLTHTEMLEVAKFLELEPVNLF